MTERNHTSSADNQQRNRVVELVGNLSSSQVGQIALADSSSRIVFEGSQVSSDKPERDGYVTGLLDALIRSHFPCVPDHGKFRITIEKL